jgi:hypothetical protein
MTKLFSRYQGHSGHRLTSGLDGSVVNDPKADVAHRRNV